MNLSRNHAIVLGTLFSLFAICSEILYADTQPGSFGDRITALQVNLRRKYSTPQSLKFYGITYQQLNDIIKNSTEKLLRQRSSDPTCECFERDLEKEVFGTLQLRASEHHATQNLSAYEVRQKIQEHELKLKRQYGKPDQLSYYKVTYQTVNDIIKETSSAMFGNNAGSMITTESQLHELFRMHTDIVLKKLERYRSR